MEKYIDDALKNGIEYQQDGVEVVLFTENGKGVCFFHALKITTSIRKS